ncbi:hypothetical protein B7R54_10830 [Subtercola boreus]|uniref:RNA polymerase sigma factor 70 region 4 type 2 domain-containing protein n=1 Tax=Subtercola boreus TaxID=120213 RepID=A0A3E0VLA6_9MICO|nr:sigma factor-like helix-turn-helix DNA-binding protein [Subtercola boreus]RFA09657.1 hypothetical protein B7R54_10830 [Subtercola boreus]TQL53260.1 DNA-binding NarL/FixJ family response regulator [Subtercola boreus]
MKIRRSMLIMDDRAVLVDGITTVAQFTYPDLQVWSGPEGLASLASTARPGRQSGESVVIVLGGSALAGLPESKPLLALIGFGATVVGLVGQLAQTDVYALRSAGVNVFVCVSEGINELLRAIERAFDGESHVSPDAEALFSRPARIAPRISPRERQIVLLYLSDNDWSVDEVSRMLRISSQTVRSHLARLRSHFTAAGFSVRNRLELRQALIEIGVIGVEPVASPHALPAAEAASRGSQRFRYTDDSAPNTKAG